MTTLAQFYSQISAEVKRGTTLDSTIPAKVQMAVAWMEREHTFLYTERFCSLIISAAAATPRAIAQPTGLKKVYFWRIVNNDNTLSRLTKVDPTDISIYGSDAQVPAPTKPKAYWQDGTDFFWLDSPPDVDYNSEMSYNQYTILSTDTSQLIPSAISLFPDVIINQTMMYMAPAMRDDKVVALYKPLRDEAMKSAIDSDVEERQSGRSESMQYGWEYKEDVNGLNTSGSH